MQFPRIEEIKKMRKHLDITQSELARMANVSQSTIAKLERNSISASYGIVTRVFEAIENEGKLRKINRTARDVLHTPIVSVHKDSTLAEVSDLMKRRGYSQLPVMNSDTVVGSVSDETILSQLRKGVSLEEFSSIKVESVMDEAYPVIAETAPVEMIAALLSGNPAVLVQRKGKISGIITKSDLLKLI